MKTAEELTALKNEVEVLNQKLSTLTEEELEQVSGGIGYCLPDGKVITASSPEQSCEQSWPFFD